MHSLLLGSIAALLLVNLVIAKEKGEACQATIECDDPGLVCSGNKCICFKDIAEDAAQVWGCNQAKDCDGLNRLAQEHMTPEKAKAAHAPVCSPSSVCDQPKGKVGYCDITLEA